MGRGVEEAVELGCGVDGDAVVQGLWGLGGEDEDEADALDILTADSDAANADAPHRQFERARTLAAIEREIARLPNRQREAFLMRYWEEMDISETAAAMGCSEGSVKTHCSRATQALAAALKAKGIVP